METYRPLLVSSSSSKKKKQNDEHNFVFMTRHGTPFAANYFSDFLSTLLFRHTGQRVATNILRSSFVTHFYSSDEAQDPVMHESVATVMRHSVDQALRVYDRRSTASKKHKGLQLLASRQSQHRLEPIQRVRHGRPLSNSCKRERKNSQPPTVVLFQRVPHQVIREVAEASGDRMLLLGKMTRSLSSNEPVYSCPPTLSSTSNCATTALEGVWLNT